eukprot:1194701-Prorocentrum_minimum.AAC.2
MHQGTLALGQGTPAMCQGTPALGQGTPAMCQGTPALGQGTPALSQGTPTMRQGTPAPSQGCVDRSAQQTSRYGFCLSLGHHCAQFELPSETANRISDSVIWREYTRIYAATSACITSRILGLFHYKSSDFATFVLSESFLIGGTICIEFWFSRGILYFRVVLPLETRLVSSGRTTL